VKQFLIYAILLLSTGGLFAQNKALALVVQIKGKSEIVRDGKVIPARVNELIQKGDLLRTYKDAAVSVQLSSGAMFKMAAETEVMLADLVRDNTGFRVKLDIRRGSLANKLDSMGAKDNYTVQAPTAVAGVRGTEFLVEINEAVNQATVLVNDGAVAVQDPEGKQGEQVCEEGNKIIADGKQMRESLLEQFEKDKMAIFAEMGKFKQANFESLVEQIRKNREMMDQHRQQLFPQGQ